MRTRYYNTNSRVISYINPYIRDYPQRQPHPNFAALDQKLITSIEVIQLQMNANLKRRESDLPTSEPEENLKRADDNLSELGGGITDREWADDVASSTSSHGGGALKPPQ